MRACRDLDQLGKTISYLCRRESAEESEIEEGVHRRVICSKAIFVVAVIYSNLDGHRSINQPYNRGRNSDEVGVPAIGSTSEPTTAVHC